MYEAADIDGAGKMQSFLYITLPMMSPMILYSAITGIIGSMQMYVQATLLGATGWSSGAANVTVAQREIYFTMPYITQTAFANQQFGRAAAISWLLFLMIMLVSGAVYLLSKRYIYYEVTDNR